MVARRLEIGSELDYEVNVAGNVVSAFEGVRVSRAILEIMELEIPEIEDE